MLARQPRISRYHTDVARGRADRGRQPINIDRAANTKS